MPNSIPMNFLKIQSRPEQALASASLDGASACDAVRDDGV
jgi:hypothetical protein